MRLISSTGQSSLRADLAVQVEVVGQVDFAHASAAQLFTDSIVAKRFSDHGD